MAYRMRCPYGECGASLGEKATLTNVDWKNAYKHILEHLIVVEQENLELKAKLEKLGQRIPVVLA